MKREFLQNFEGLSKEAIDAIMDENGRDIERERSKRADYDTIKEQLAAANRQIEEFKGMDIDGVKKAAEEWKAKAEQAEREASERIAEMEFNGTLKEAITAAKGRNAKAISALLDVPTLRDSENQAEDIKAALEALKQESGYLFETETPPPFSAGAGQHDMSGDPEMAAIRAAAGLKGD